MAGKYALSTQLMIKPCVKLILFAVASDALKFNIICIVNAIVFVILTAYKLLNLFFKCPGRNIFTFSIDLNIVFNELNHNIRGF